MQRTTDHRQGTSVSVFFGDANDAIARIYARLDGSRDELAGLTLSGRVVGPLCEYANTLPAQVPLMDRGIGDSLLAEAIIPDPCFWTPELPFLYRVQVELRRGSALLQTIERPLGIRRLGARGKDLFLEGKRYVIRGISLPGLAAAGTAAREDPSPAGRGQGEGVAELPFAHATQTALCVASPSDELCEAASRLGTMLIADVDDAAELERLARWAAVGITVLDASENVPAELRAKAPNLLLAQRGADLASPRPWAQLLIGQIDNTAGGTGWQPVEVDCGLPILVQRRVSQPLPLEAARAACDQLQADLAPANFAGYLV